MMTECIDIYLNTLNYHKNWLEFGFLDKESLIQQVDDINTEHYRYCAFLKFIKRHEVFSDLQVEQFIILTNQDKDAYMAGSALQALYLSAKLNTYQKELIVAHMLTFGHWTKKVIKNE